MFCNVSERDKPQTLCAAGTFHPSTQTNNELHVYDFTEKIKNMALFLDDLEIFSKLSTGNVASSEIYYHKICLNALVNRYSSEKTKVQNSSLYIEKEKGRIDQRSPF